MQSELFVLSYRPLRSLQGNSQRFLAGQKSDLLAQPATVAERANKPGRPHQSFAS